MNENQLLAALAAMQEALYSGDLKVTYTGPQGTRSVEYRTAADLLKAIANLKSELAALTGAALPRANPRSSGYF